MLNLLISLPGHPLGQFSPTYTLVLLASGVFAALFFACDKCESEGAIWAIFLSATSAMALFITPLVGSIIMEPWSGWVGVALIGMGFLVVMMTISAFITFWPTYCSGMLLVAAAACVGQMMADDQSVAATQSVPLLAISNALWWALSAMAVAGLTARFGHLLAGYIAWPQFPDEEPVPAQGRDIITNGYRN